MVSKVAVAGLSLLLVAGIIIGIVATATRVRNHDNGGISTGMKAVETLCAPTDYKELCINTLAPAVRNNPSVTPKDLVQVSHEAILEEVKKALDKSISLGKDVTNSYDKMSMDDCRDLLTYGVGELEEAVSLLVDSKMEELSELTADLNNWLGAVLSHKSFCLENLNNPELSRAMNEGLMNTTHLTYNALGIIDLIDQILGKANATTSVNNSRRLLVVNGDGFPTWLNAADRKLLESDNNQIRPNAVVAQDGSGQFKTITEAIAACPKKNKARYIIYVKAGVYQEYVVVPKNTRNVFMYGDDKSKTIVTGDRDSKRKGFTTQTTATFAAIGNRFMAKSIGFRNTAGPAGGQALALRVLSDKSVFYDCIMEGYQDTLCTEAKRQFYHRCVISGTVDFIFGIGTAVIHDSDIIVRLPEKGQFNAITADGRENSLMHSGISIQNCRIIPEDKLEQQKLNIESYLGRPWKNHSRTMVMESDIGDFIKTEGWHRWNDMTNYHETCEYREYANRGPGADVSQRVKWGGFAVVTDARVAQQYRVAEFLKGSPKVKGNPKVYLES